MVVAHLGLGCCFWQPGTRVGSPASLGRDDGPEASTQECQPDPYAQQSVQVVRAGYGVGADILGKRLNDDNGDIYAGDMCFV